MHVSVSVFFFHLWILIPGLTAKYGCFCLVFHVFSNVLFIDKAVAQSLVVNTPKHVSTNVNDFSVENNSIKIYVKTRM